MKSLKSICLLLILSCCLALSQAQDTGVWITTQDYTSFRTGPGLNWERAAVIDPVITLPAIGRTSDTRWIQVVYEGETGWINWNLVVWSGNISDLPVDGVQAESFVRQVGIAGITTRETPIYRSGVDPSDQVGILPIETPVEIVGRLGSGRFFQYQIFVNGQVYWVGSWNIRITERNSNGVLDNSYRYAYGRLLRQFNDDFVDGESRLAQIEQIWRALQGGSVVSCRDERIPLLLPPRTVSDGDIEQEPTFISAALLLDTAIGATNTAIAAFVDACNRGDIFITNQDIRAALDEVDNGRRHFNLSRSILASLRLRDPLREN